MRCGHQFPEEEQVSHQPSQQIVQPSTQPIQQTAQPSQQQNPPSKSKQKKEIDIEFWILVTLLFILGIIVYIFTREPVILIFGIIIVVIIWGIYKIDEKWKALREFFKGYYQELKESRKKTWIVVGIVLIVIIIIVIAAVSVPPSTAPVQFTVDKVILDKTTPSLTNDVGHTYYIFNITIKNTGSNNIDVYPSSFYLVTSDGAVSETIISAEETNPLKIVILSPGQTVTGQLEFAVQNGATLKAIYFEYEYQNEYQKYYAPSIPEPSGCV
jgi:heme/copper-type cytochrome/quinol oxidase subunit 2